MPKDSPNSDRSQPSQIAVTYPSRRARQAREYAIGASGEQGSSQIGLLLGCGTLAILLVLYLAVFWIAPVLVIKQLQDSYRDHGDDFLMTIGHWSFAPHRAQLELNDVVLHHHQTRDGWQRFALKLDPAALFNRQLVIQDLQIEQLKITIDANSADTVSPEAESSKSETPIKEIRIAGLPLPSMTDSEVIDEVPSEAELSHTKSMALEALITQSLPQDWSLRWPTMDIMDIAVNFNAKDPSQQLSIRSETDLYVGSFDSTQSQALQLTIKQTFNQFDLQQFITQQPASVQSASTSPTSNAAKPTGTDSLSYISKEDKALIQGSRQRLFKLTQPFRWQFDGSINHQGILPSIRGNINSGSLQLKIQQPVKQPQENRQQENQEPQVDNPMPASSADLMTTQLGFDKLILKDLSANWLNSRLDLNLAQLDLSQLIGSGLQHFMTAEGLTDKQLPSHISVAKWQLQNAQLELNPLEPRWNWKLQQSLQQMILTELQWHQVNGDRLVLGRLMGTDITSKTVDGELMLTVASFETNNNFYQPHEAAVPVVALAHYKVSQVQADRRQLSIGLQQVKGLLVNLERSAQGQWQWFRPATVAMADEIKSEAKSGSYSSDQLGGISSKDIPISLTLADVYGADAVVNPPVIEPLSILPSDLMEPNQQKIQPQINQDLASISSPSSNSSAQSQNSDRLESINPLKTLAQKIEQTLQALPLDIVIDGVQFSVPASLDEGMDTIAAAKILLVDKAVIPAVSQLVTIQQAELSAFDSRFYRKPVQLSVILQFDEFNRSQVDLTASVKADDIIINSRISTEELNIVPLNPYIIDAIGHRVTRGQLSVVNESSVEQGQLTSSNNITLSNIQLATADAELVKGLESQLALPLTVSLQMMADDKGRVRLSVPVNGSLTNPDFSVVQIAQKAAGIALKKGTLVYLSQALQPYGTMLGVAKFMGKRLFSIRLDALTFSANNAELTPQLQRQLLQVESLLETKTEINLVVCPTASNEEQSTLGDNWITLADQRGLAVKRYFVNRNDQNGRLLTDRIILCEAEVSNNSEVILGIK